MFRTGTIPSEDGLRLFYRLRRSDDAKASVLLLHGFAEHSGRYSHLLDALYDAQFNVMALDLRGHGYSEGKRGFIESMDQYLGDVRTAIQFAKKTFGDQEIAIVAHSMGGLVATLFAAKYPQLVRALVLSSPLFGIKMAVPAWKRGLAFWLSKRWPSFSLPNEIDAKNLTHDEKMQEAYERDPILFHHATARWFSEIVRSTQDIFDKASQIEMPLLMQLAGDDRIVNSEAAKLFFENCKSQDRTLQIYDGFLHEIYNEKEREKPIEDFVRWLVSRVNQSPGLTAQQTQSGIGQKELPV